MILDSFSQVRHEAEFTNNWPLKCKIELFTDCAAYVLNKRAQRALGRSPEEKVKGQGKAI